MKEVKKWSKKIMKMVKNYQEQFKRIKHYNADNNWTCQHEYEKLLSSELSKGEGISRTIFRNWCVQL